MVTKGGKIASTLLNGYLGLAEKRAGLLKSP